MNELSGARWLQYQFNHALHKWLQSFKAWQRACVERDPEAMQRTQQECEYWLNEERKFHALLKAR